MEKSSEKSAPREYSRHAESFQHYAPSMASHQPDAVRVLAPAANAKNVLFGRRIKFQGAIRRANDVFLVVAVVACYRALLNGNA